MTKTNEDVAEAKGDASDRFSADLQALKGSFATLRADVAKLVDTTKGTGRSGAAVLKNRASNVADDVEDRLGDLRDYCADSAEALARKISQRPVLSVAVALGIGFILCGLLRPRR